MPSASLFEQLTSSVSLSMLSIVSITILVLLLIYTVACRAFFSSSKTSPSKQQVNKEKKPKDSNTAKKQQIETISNNKKKNNKINNNVSPVSSPSTQSEESENDKTPIISIPKKSPKSRKPRANKNGAITDDSNKINFSANENKPLLTKQKEGFVRPDNIEALNENNKSKEIKSNATIISNKPKPQGKRDGTSKINLTSSKKNESILRNSEVKRTFIVDGEGGSDQEDDGQWVTQGSKQLNNRNRNKGKMETSNATNQTLSNHNIVSEQRIRPTTPEINISSSVNNDELNVETKTPSTDLTLFMDKQEPIEIYQLLPKNENLYTSTDKWWKQPLNKKQTFSIDDIGEWPEHEQDDQYIVQIKQIIPAKQLNEKQTSDEL